MWIVSELPAIQIESKNCLFSGSSACSNSRKRLGACNESTAGENCGLSNRLPLSAAAGDNAWEVRQPRKNPAAVA